MKKQVNYNEISQVYDARYSYSTLEGVSKYLKTLLADKSPSYILEVGCGTGHWLSELSKINTELPFGLDSSIGMLNRARKPFQEFNLVNGDANQLPFIKEIFDLVIVVNAIHHFTKPIDFISEVKNIIKSGGTLCIIGFEPRESEHTWYLYRYFESTYRKDLHRYPTFMDLKNELENSGITNIKTKLVHQIDTFKKGDEIFNDHFLDKRGASQLALLSDKEYQKGINKIKNDILKAAKKNKEIIFETKLNFYSVTGTK